MFLRIRKDLEMTGTFKHTTDALIREGYDPAATRVDRNRGHFIGCRVGGRRHRSTAVGPRGAADQDLVARRCRREDAVAEGSAVQVVGRDVDPASGAHHLVGAPDADAPVVGCRRKRRPATIEPDRHDWLRVRAQGWPELTQAAYIPDDHRVVVRARGEDPAAVPECERLDPALVAGQVNRLRTPVEPEERHELVVAAGREERAVGAARDGPHRVRTGVLQDPPARGGAEARP